ncbi:MAG: hypothetical protein KJ043_23375, partial [Anaerolineae bacterium]|nr:hypothetical protein [Anaerolineae bacterium]
MEYSGATLVFNLYPYGADGGFEAEAYIWQMAINTITQASNWGQPIMDVLPASGDRVYLDVDPSLPSGDEPVGDIPHFNAVRIVDESSLTPRTIYHRPEGAFFDVTFVNEGQQIAVKFISDQIDVPPHWILIDRTGETTDINKGYSDSDIQNAPGGYVNFWVGLVVGTPTMIWDFHVVYTTDEGSVTLWDSEPSENSINWELAWVQPVIGIPDLTYFPNYRR